MCCLNYQAYDNRIKNFLNDLNVDRLRYLGEVFMGRVETLYSNNFNITQAVKNADLVVGAVLIPGAKAPKLVTEEMVKLMSC
jgi:alanine dehydrogenase